MQTISRQPETAGGFADAFSQGLQGFAQAKMQDLERRSQGKMFEKLIPGLTPEKAQAFAFLPPLAQKEFIRSGLLGMFTDQQQPSGTDLQSNMQQGLQQLENIAQPTFDNRETLTRALPGGMSPVQQAQLSQTPSLPAQSTTTGQIIPREVNANDRIKQQLQAIIVNPLIPIQQKNAAFKQLKDMQKYERKEAFEREKISLKEQYDIDKTTRPIHHALVKDYKAAIDNDLRLNRMEELVKKGDLSRPRWHSLLNTLEHGVFGFGIDLHSLETSDSQQFNKLSKDFLKNIKDVFGARITDQDLKSYLKTIPDLSQSREGKLSVIYNNRLFNEGVKARYAAAQKVLQQNNGKFPRDYDDQIEKLVGPALDSISNRFIAGVKIHENLKEKSTLQNIAAGDPMNILLGQG